MCTVVQNENGMYENGPSAANLAISRINRCISIFTKGGPSSKRGGGQASSIIQHFEEKLQGETDKVIIANSSDSSDSQTNLLYLLRRYLFKTANLENFQGRTLQTIL